MYNPFRPVCIWCGIIFIMIGIFLSTNSGLEIVQYYLNEYGVASFLKFIVISFLTSGVLLLIGTFYTTDPIEDERVELVHRLKEIDPTVEIKRKA